MTTPARWSLELPIPRSASARAAWAAFLVVLPIYLATMNPTIGFVDRGELAAVATTFGIAHATGYPTLMLLGGIVTRLVPFPPVLVLNVFAAVLAAVGAGLLALLFDRFLARVQTSALAERTRAALALLAALFVATTMTWWQQANGFEVYAFHEVMMPLVVLLFLRWSDAAAEDRAGETSAGTRRAGWIFALVVGLAFTNHLTTLLLAPGLLIAAAVRFGKGVGLWRRILPLAPPFALGLLPYAWLPIRSSMHPRLDWGNTDTPHGFLHHLTGGDYQQWMFSSVKSMALQARYLSWRVPSDFLWIGLLVAALGLFLIARRRPALALLAGGLVAMGCVFPVGYSILDLDSYLLTAMLGLGLCFAAGLLRVHERYGARAALVAAIALVASNAAFHWRECDERDNRMAQAFVSDLIGPLPQGALLLTSLWDLGYSSSIYFQEVEGFRGDVVVISTNLAKRSWYLDQLDRRHPELFARSATAFRAYRDTLRAVEQGQPSTIRRLEAARAVFLDALVAGCMPVRPVFATGALAEVNPALRRVPWHLALWLRADTSYVPEPAWHYAFRPWHGRIDIFATRTYQAYAESRVERALYEARHGRESQAQGLLGEATRFDPRLHPSRIAPLPVGGEEEVLRTARFFHDLSGIDPVSAARGWGAIDSTAAGGTDPSRDPT